jgi:biotin transport system substrate-specific component
MTSNRAIPQPKSIPVSASLSPTTLAAARMGVVVAFALLTAAAASIKYPVPGSPVPATLQTLVVLTSGLLLGPWLGSASMALYLALGAAGLPVFASGGGVQTIAGATGGYLIAFVFVQPMLGRFVSAERRSILRVLLALVIAQTFLFACGLSWLKIAGDLSWSDTLRMGFWPFVPVDALLKTIGALILGVWLVRPVRGVLAIR